MATTPKAHRDLRRERQKELIRESILEAALSEFMAKGYHDTGMEAIAARAGYAVGSLYHYFKGKMDIYMILHERISDNIEAAIRGIAVSDVSFEEKLQALVEQHYVSWDIHGSFIMTELVDPPTYNRAEAARMRQSHHQRFSDLVDLLSGIMQAGIDRKLLRPMPPKQHTIALVGLIRAMTMYWEHNPPKPSVAQRSTEVLDLFYRGAAAPSHTDHRESTI